MEGHDRGIPDRQGLKREEGKMKRKIPLAATALLLVLAVAACLYGAFRGELKTVHRKASTVCLECIGIG